MLVGSLGSHVTSGAAAVVTLLALPLQPYLPPAPLLVRTPGRRHPIRAATVAGPLAPGLPPAPVTRLLVGTVAAAAASLVGSGGGGHSIGATAEPRSVTEDGQSRCQVSK